MPTARKSKDRKLSPKKGFMVDKGETGATGTVEAQTAPASAAGTEITAKEKHQFIAEAAYFRAERRNFNPGYELEDWLGAEAEIEMMLSRIHSDGPPRKA